MLRLIKAAQGLPGLGVLDTSDTVWSTRGHRTMSDPAPQPPAAAEAGPLHPDEVILGSLSSGVITPEEIEWISAHQGTFTRQEEAAALKLGRLIDQGQIQLGCRLQA